MPVASEVHIDSRSSGWLLARVALVPRSTSRASCGIRPASISGCSEVQSAERQPTTTVLPAVG